MQNLRDAIYGLICGDALGFPVQFMDRDTYYISEMEPETEIYKTPAGTWSDDSSMTLATLDSIYHKGSIVLEDIIEKFCEWETKGKYTPFGVAIDQGNTTTDAIYKYLADKDIDNCGRFSVNSNGNGSLMRILPVCLFTDDVEDVEQVSALTHAHKRSLIACGFYFFVVKELQHGNSLNDAINHGIEKGFAYYSKNILNLTELSYFGRLKELDQLSRDDIKSGGYVVTTLEAALWCLLKTDSYKDALLLAVNLGDDTDTIGAVTGGLAGLYYGYDNIPKEWIDAIQNKALIDSIIPEDFTFILENILNKLGFDTAEAFIESEKSIIDKYRGFEIERKNPLTKLTIAECKWFQAYCQEHNLI